MSAALRHHKQQLHIGGRHHIGITAATTSTMNDSHHTSNSNYDDHNDNDDEDDNQSSHCSLSDELHQPISRSTAATSTMPQQQHQQQQPPPPPQYSIGTPCKKVIFGGIARDPLIRFFFIFSFRDSFYFFILFYLPHKSPLYKIFSTSTATGGAVGR